MGIDWIFNPLRKSTLIKPLWDHPPWICCVAYSLYLLLQPSAISWEREEKPLNQSKTLTSAQAWELLRFKHASFIESKVCSAALKHAVNRAIFPKGSKVHALLALSSATKKPQQIVFWRIWVKNRNSCTEEWRGNEWQILPVRHDDWTWNWCCRDQYTTMQKKWLHVTKQAEAFN